MSASNGTVSLVVALLAMGIEPGDEVIVPPYTFIGTANAVRLVDAVPVFVDISIGHAGPCGLPHQLAAARWDADAVRDDLRGCVVDHLHHPDPTA